MTLKQMIGVYGIAAVIAILVNGAIAAGVVWLVVVMLRWLGVIN